MISFIFTPDGSIIFPSMEGSSPTNNGKLPDVISNYIDLIKDNKQAFIEALTKWFLNIERNELAYTQLVSDLRDQLNQSTLQQQLNEALSTIQQRDAIIAELRREAESHEEEDDMWVQLMAGWFNTSLGRRTRSISAIDRIDLLAGIILKSELLVREAFAVILQRMVELEEPYTEQELKEVQQLFVDCGFEL